MNPGQTGMDARMKAFQEELRSAGIKLTPQRIAIFREIIQACDHPDAETLHGRLRGGMPSLSLDTVYRTLWLLSDLGLIRTMGPGRERIRFEPNLDRHHHFVCTECGLTRDFQSDEFDSIRVPASASRFGRIRETHVEVRGICRSCAGEDPGPVLKEGGHGQETEEIREEDEGPGEGP